MELFKTLFLFLLLICFGKAINFFGYHDFPFTDTPKSYAAIQDSGTIIQRVNHFNPADDRTWTMRYVNNSQFYKDGGPIFIFLGGEWNIDFSAAFLQGGQMFDMAEENNGYMYATEHRFYGESYPLSDFSSESLQFQTADQAIEDLAYFITQNKRDNSKVIIVGASYSGLLATWAKIKYPHLITAVLASSAPLLATKENYSFFEIVSNNIEQASPKCMKTISDGIAEMEEALEDEDSKMELEKLLMTCKPIITEEPYRSHLFGVVIGMFAGLVQYAKDGDIQKTCDIIMEYEGGPMEKVSKYVRSFFGDICIADYDAHIQIYQNNETTTDIFRPWYYQTCTQLGIYPTTSTEGNLFGDTVRLEYHLQMCKDLFGENYTPVRLDLGIERSKIFFGSSSPEVTKVIFTHGTVDPWHGLGILEDLSPLAPAILIEGGSHCADLNSLSKNDSPQMQAAKLKVKETIAKWIQ